MNDAQVVCRELGCGKAIRAPIESFFGQGYGQIWLQSVNCKGTESSLQQCQHLGFGKHNCNHNEDASVVCSGSIALFENYGMINPGAEIMEELAHTTMTTVKPYVTDIGSVRLVNGGGPCAGRVEIFYNGTWGTVCDDHWRINNAHVVCRQLNCGSAISATEKALFGLGTGQIWLDNVNCNGNEESLTQCKASTWGKHDCKHEEDAGVVCSDHLSGSPHKDMVTRPVLPDGKSPDIISKETTTEITELPEKTTKTKKSQDIGGVRLVNGGGPCAGRVEIFYKNYWGTICDDFWGIKDADVVCRQLNCGFALLATEEAHFGSGTGHIWLDNVNCEGNEVSLTQCKSAPWGLNNCGHHEDAGVVCSDHPQGLPPKSTKSNLDIGMWPNLKGSDIISEKTKTAMTELAETTKSTPTFHEYKRVRLVNGGGSCAGRVEIFHNYKWGTVCDDSWSMKEAHVVCRQLNCGSAISAKDRAFFGEGTGLIWLDDLNCEGDEESLTQCKAAPWGEHNCGHNEDAGVICSDQNTHTSEPFFEDDHLSTKSHLPKTTDSHQIPTTESSLYSFSVTSSNVLKPSETGPTSDQMQITATNSPTDAFSGTVSKSEENPSSTDSLRLRVVNGRDRCSGRVEIFVNGSWGTVCDDSWDINDAEVVCRELGCGEPLSAPQEAFYGFGTGDIWLTQINCTGTELSLLQCNHPNVGTEDCSHGEDASVICSEKYIHQDEASLLNTSEAYTSLQQETTTVSHLDPYNNVSLDHLTDAPNTSLASQYLFNVPLTTVSSEKTQENKTDSHSEVFNPFHSQISKNSSQHDSLLNKPGGSVDCDNRGIPEGCSQNHPEGRQLHPDKINVINCECCQNPELLKMLKEMKEDFSVFSRAYEQENRELRLIANKLELLTSTVNRFVNVLLESKYLDTDSSKKDMFKYRD